MADRPTWTGVLKISLVTIPIKVYPATSEGEKIAFHHLHEPCQARIQQKKVCPSCRRDVPAEELVKGFEFETGRYVILSADELDAVAPPSTRVIEVTQFAKASALEPRAIQRAYYLVPDGPGPAREAYDTLGHAMGATVGLGTLAIYGREYLVAVAAPRRAITSAPTPLLLYTLHDAAELRPLPGRSASVLTTKTQLGDSGVVRLVRQLIAAMTRPLDLAAFTDAYQADLRRLIDAKIAGEEIVVPIVPDLPAVTTLKDALTQSLAAVRGTTSPRRIAKAGLSPRARVD